MTYFTIVRSSNLREDRYGIILIFDFYMVPRTFHQNDGSLGTASEGSLMGLKFRKKYAVAALVANFPQLVLSAIYYIYNGLFTTYLLADEFNQMGSARKGLRVSTVPKGSQRTTYFLQLPYRFAVPLILLSVLFHWICSESFFVVDILNPPMNAEIVDCGYSGAGMMLLFFFGFFMLAVALLFGIRTFSNAMPVAGSCSASISAMCHPLPNSSEDMNEAVYLPLQWGVTGYVEDQAGNWYIHCCFSSKQVTKPKDGQRFLLKEPIRRRLTEIIYFG